VAETLAVAADVAVQNKAEPKYLIDLQATLADARSTTDAMLPHSRGHGPGRHHQQRHHHGHRAEQQRWVGLSASD
jgi:hypothetical protein